MLIQDLRACHKKLCLEYRSKKGPLWLSSSKVVSRTFLATHKQTDDAELKQLYKWLSTWFWKEITSWKHLQINIEASSSVYDYNVFNDSWFLILKMNEYLFFTDFICLKSKINQDKQPARPSHMSWPVPREGKVLWKTTTKIKVSFTEKKVFFLTFSWRRPLSYRNQSILISRANQWTGFYMITASVMKELKKVLYFKVSAVY